MLEKEEDHFSASVVFSHFEKLPPYRMLQEIEEVGIRDIYILLNQEEYEHAMEDKYQLLDNSEPLTFLGHYQSFSDKQLVQFHVIKTGDTKNDQEKLQYFIENNTDKYTVNIFVTYQKSFPWVTPELRTQVLGLKKNATQYQFFKKSVFEKERWSHEVYEMQPKSSDKALELLNRKDNPCYCHERNQDCDALYYQWLFNIFSELALQALPKAEERGSFSNHAEERIRELVKNYYQNIFDVEKINKKFEQLHRIVYPTDIEKYFKTKEHKKYPQFQKIIAKREAVEHRFIEIIKGLMDVYLELKQNSRPRMRKQF
jgi:hypothetical protein